MKSIGIQKYNQNSGFFFVDCLKNQLQRKDYAAAIESLKLLRDKPCYYSTSSYLYSYDTESDSDQEKHHNREEKEEEFEEQQERRKRRNDERSSRSSVKERKESQRQRAEEKKKTQMIKKR